MSAAHANGRLESGHRDHRQAPVFSIAEVHRQSRIESQAVGLCGTQLHWKRSVVKTPGPHR